CRYLEFPQQLLGLVFVNVHRRRSTTKRGTFAHSIEFLPRTGSRNNRSSLQRAAAHFITGIGKAVAAEHVSQQIQIATRGSIIRGGHCHKPYCRTARGSMRRRKEKCLSHIFTIAASSFIRNSLRFFHEITTLNHNSFDHSGTFWTCRQRGTRESVRREIQNRP